MRDNINREYTKEWLQFERPQPMYDSSINKFYDNFYKENPVHTQNLDQKFKDSFIKWLDNHSLNSFKGYEDFKRLDISHGCTQYIDDIYQRLGKDNVMIFENDYKYHWRLNNQIKYTTIDTLDPKKELLIAMPFPYYGNVHPQMSEILDRCYQLKIPVHIDGAWISCCRDINFNFGHPSIESFCISLSKGGMGGNRIGLRFSKSTPKGPITIMNDFNMNSQCLISMGIKFMETFGPEYFWKKYQKEYNKVCKDFNLIPTNAIHLAKTNEGMPVGIRPLLRYLL
jgi:hypothetical protein